MAYTLTKADVLLAAAELASLDDPRWAQALALAQAVVANPSAWGGDSNAKNAATQLCAHFAKLMLVAKSAKPGQLPSGPVVEIRVGPVSKGFASLADFVGDKGSFSASLALTTYGVTFAALQKLFSFGRFTVA